MSTKPIGVGVIGCGEIAQIMHLPILSELPAFCIAAVCDISAGTMTAMAERFAVTGRYADHRQLLADPAVEAVVICTYDHGEIVRDALAAGKHLIVEKPLAFTPAEARSLVAAAEASGLVALVGYMKFYDDGYRKAVDRIATLGRPRAVQVHDFAGRFDRYGRLYDQVRADDVPAAMLQAGRAAVEARIAAELGPDHAHLVELYLTLLMLGSHDLAVLRGAFGKPDAVRYAARTAPHQLLAVLDLAGGVPCVLEIGVGSRYEWWDEWLSVHGDEAELRVEFPHPYFRQGSTLVRIKEAAGEVPSDRVIVGSPDSPFRREWQHFGACIRGEARPATPLSGGLDDLDLAVAIIKAIVP